MNMCKHLYGQRYVVYLHDLFKGGFLFPFLLNSILKERQNKIVGKEARVLWAIRFPCLIVSW